MLCLCMNLRPYRHKVRMHTRWCFRYCLHTWRNWCNAATNSAWQWNGGEWNWWRYGMMRKTSSVWPCMGMTSNIATVWFQGSEHTWAEDRCKAMWISSPMAQTRFGTTFTLSLVRVASSTLGFYTHKCGKHQSRNLNDISVYGSYNYSASILGHDRIVGMAWLLQWLLPWWKPCWIISWM